MEQIFQDLKRAGLVTSKRGPRGGYTLAQPPSELRVGDIIRALEGPVSLAGEDDLGSDEDPTSHAVTEAVFTQLSEDIQACFDAVTIEDLCARGEAEVARHAPPRRYVYSI